MEIAKPLFFSHLPSCFCILSFPSSSLLKDSEMLCLFLFSPIYDTMLLWSIFPASATRFLHENGVLLHYNDQLRGLNHLYFIDARWVCELIATLVTIRERNPFIMDGVMKMKDLELVLRDPKFPQQFIPQVTSIL